MKNHLQRGLDAKRESKYVDFKGTLDLGEPGAWCEVVKDIIAMTNSGGGVLLIGLDNKGVPTGFDPEAILALDEAKVTDQIFKYTGEHFDGFTISEERKGGNRIAAILIDASPTPIAFTKPGTYAVDEKKQKTSFSQGTVYFRHGAKSDPGDTGDLRKAIERRVEEIRAGWLSGVRKVVKADPGSQFFAFPARIKVRDSASVDAQAIRIVDDPDAPAFQRLDFDLTHPFRQKEAIAEINRGLAGKAAINQFDVQCINRVYEIQGKENFCHCPRYSSPQYSREYVAWVISQYEQDNGFFAKTRATDYNQRH